MRTSLSRFVDKCVEYVKVKGNIRVNEIETFQSFVSGLKSQHSSIKSVQAGLSQVSNLCKQFQNQPQVFARNL